MLFKSSLIHGVAIVVFFGAACAEGEPPDTGSQPVALGETPTLATFIAEHLQIDETDSPPVGDGPGDVNLFVGDDPADSTASVDLPAGGSTYIDWDDLGGDLANHQLLDLNDARGTDHSSFPRKNECVGSSKVLDKMDLTYVAMANNTDYAYIAVQRANNNGDAGYYWLLSRAEPTQTPAGGPCKADENQLLFTLAEGDVLLVGHFAPSAGPILRAFTVNAGVSTTVDAIAAIDFSDASIWTEVHDAVVAAGVNTTDTAAGSLGTAGVTAASGGVMEKHIFAEAAIDIDLLTGGEHCGASFFGTVITRSSGAGGTTPDVKDLAGPAVFVLGDTTADAEVTPSCEAAVGLSASATGPDGEPIESATCTWDLGTGGIHSGCDLDLPLAPGDYSGTVTVEDPVSGCSDTFTTDQFTIYQPLTATADMGDNSCDMQLAYSASADHGSGNYSYAWSFDGPGSATPSDPSAASGTLTAGAGGEYTGTVVVTDSRDDGLDCTVEVGDAASTYPGLQVTAALTGPSCDLELPYSATITGGSGDHTISWTVSGPGTPGLSAPGATSGIVTATEGGSHTVTVVVEDNAEGLPAECQASDSASEVTFAPLVATADLGSATCDLVLPYGVTVQGGSGSFGYAWSFSGPSSATPSDPSAQSGTLGLGGAGIYTGEVAVTDQYPGLPATCNVVTSDTGETFSPLGVSLSLVSSPVDCPDMTSDDVAYQAVVTGGTGGVTYDWNIDACDGSASCVVDFAAAPFCGDQPVQVTVHDAAQLCDPKPSETELASKVTIVTASDIQ